MAPQIAAKGSANCSHEHRESWPDREKPEGRGYFSLALAHGLNLPLDLSQGSFQCLAADRA